MLSLLLFLLLCLQTCQSSQIHQEISEMRIYSRNLDFAYDHWHSFPIRSLFLKSIFCLMLINEDRFFFLMKVTFKIAHTVHNLPTETSIPSSEKMMFIRSMWSIVMRYLIQILKLIMVTGIIYFQKKIELPTQYPHPLFFFLNPDWRSADFVLYHLYLGDKQELAEVTDLIYLLWG